MTKDDDQSKPDPQTELPQRPLRGALWWRDIRRGTKQGTPQQESIAAMLEEAYKAGVDYERARCARIVGERARMSTYGDTALARIAGEAFAMAQEIHGLARCADCAGAGGYEGRECAACGGVGWRKPDNKCASCKGKGFTWDDVFSEERCEDCGGSGFVEPPAEDQRSMLRKNADWLVNSERDACIALARRIAKDNLEACAQFPHDGMMIEARALNQVADWMEARGSWKWNESWQCHSALIDVVDLRVYPDGRWVVWVCGQSQADGEEPTINSAKLVAIRRARAMAQQGASDYTDYVLAVLERYTLADAR